MRGNSRAAHGSPSRRPIAPRSTGRSIRRESLTVLMKAQTVMTMRLASFGSPRPPGWRPAALHKTLSTPFFAVRDLKRGETARERAGFDRVRRAERHYGVQLRKIAKAVGDIVAGFPPGDPEAEPLIRRALERYSELIQPWAKSVAASMLVDVSRRDERVWMEITREMGAAMREEIRRAPTGEVLRKAMAEQVRLITSLPIEAAQRVHNLTYEALADSRRAAEIAEEIMRSGEVTASRALLIARTEVGRAGGELTKARALHIDSPGYIWRTMEDADVRLLHRKLEGKFFTWDKPPVTMENGSRSLPGGCPNCRCYAEVVIPKGLI